MTANRQMALRVVWATRADDHTPGPDTRELLEMCGLVAPGGHVIAPDIVAGLPVGGHVGKIPSKVAPSSSPLAQAESGRRPENCTTPPGLRDLPAVSTTPPPTKRKPTRRGLQADLDELECTDPYVAAAAASYDRMVERITGRPMPQTSPETQRLIAAEVNPATAAILAAGPTARSTP